MQKSEFIQKLAKNALSTINALNSLYRGKTYVIFNGDIFYSFAKTKRGAEGYIRRHEVTYYDDYTQDMVSSEFNYIELLKSDLPNLNDARIWYDTIYANWRRQVEKSEYESIIKLAEQHTDANVINYLESVIDDVIKTNSILSYAYNEISAEAETTDENNQTIAENEETTEFKATMALNDELNGIELSFVSKPSEQIREQLKAHGFRWSRAKKIWYAKQTEDRIKFSESLTGKQSAMVAEYPSIDIDDLDSYKVPENLSKAENNSHWIFRASETDWNTDLQNTLQSAQNKVKELLKQTDNQSVIYNLKKSLQHFKKHYAETFVKYLSHRANNPSWVVTGRGNLNVNRYNKAQDREYNLLQKLTELKEGIENKIQTFF